MAADGPSDVAASEWHSVRPWMPRLILSVREITSVSATFVLSSSLSEEELAEQNSYLESIGLEPDDESDDNATAGASDEPKKPSIISRTLAKGLSVNVNQSVWPKVFIKIDDKADEAIIIIHGLLPGKQYDVDLEVVHDAQNKNIRKQVTTEAPPLPSVDEMRNGGATQLESSNPSDSASHANDKALSINSITVEDRVAQLQKELADLNTERDTVTATLKSARRDTQKADAALRAEIDILKRTSEKNAAFEHRARQKVLALQEAVKRAQNATQEIEALVTEVQEKLPGLDEQRKAKEAEYTKIKDRADAMQKEREKIKEQEQKRAEALKSEWTGLNNKLGKLGAKREKLENTIIPDLEKQLEEIELEIERAKAGYTHSHDAEGDGISANPQAGHPPSYRRRSHHHPPGAIGRPQAPVHKPDHAGPSNLNHSPWQGKQVHRGAFHQNHPHGPARHAPHPSKQSHIRQSSQPHPTQGASSAASPPMRTTGSISATSTLSSRALPFEPGRGLRSFQTLQAKPSPIQRPGRSIGPNGEPMHIVRSNTMPS